ncbi:MAG: hypothetical protein LAQ30_31525, partial [Acidobacteriia bacterium]|nr:hypothetical protein [Terriglobia bacterium]
RAVFARRSGPLTPPPAFRSISLESEGEKTLKDRAADRITHRFCYRAKKSNQPAAYHVAVSGLTLTGVNSPDNLECEIGPGARGSETGFAKNVANPRTINNMARCDFDEGQETRFHSRTRRFRAGSGVLGLNPTPAAIRQAGA